MISVPPLHPYRPRKPKRPSLRPLQSRMHPRKPLLPVSKVRREKTQPNRVRHTSRHPRQPRPDHPQVRPLAHSLLHPNHRSPPQAHITPITRTTTLLILMRPIMLLTRRMATHNLILRILNLPQCTRSTRRAIIHHCSPIHHSFTLPTLLRNRLPHSAVLTIFQVMRR